MAEMSSKCLLKRGGTWSLLNIPTVRFMISSLIKVGPREVRAKEDSISFEVRGGGLSVC